MKTNIFPRHTVNLSPEIFSMVFRAIKNRQIFDGSCIKEFEEKFASYHQIKYARGLFSARHGLYLALKTFHFSDEAEVIISAFNYYEIPRLIKICGLNPVFVDSHPQTFNMDTTQIKKHITSKTKAILITHTFGQPCDMDALMRIAQEYNLKVIENCAHSCGAEYKGRKVGTFGDVGIFSFGLGKNIPCFGGGMILTNNDYLWHQINAIFKEYRYPSISDLTKIIFLNFISYAFTLPKIFSYTVYPILRILNIFNLSISSYEENPRPFSKIEMRRYQKRMINLQAAVGLRQLERIDNINVKLRENALLYNRLLRDNKMIQVPMEIPDARHIYLYYCFTMENRQLFRKILLKKGIDTEKNHLFNCPAFEMFSGLKDTFPASEMLARMSVDLPNNIHLAQDDIKYIVDCVQQTIKEMENGTLR